VFAFKDEFEKKVSRWIWGDWERRVRLFALRDGKMKMKEFEDKVYEILWMIWHIW